MCIMSFIMFRVQLLYSCTKYANSGISDLHSIRLNMSVSFRKVVSVIAESLQYSLNS
jgi:hypothetical protein